MPLSLIFIIIVEVIRLRVMVKVVLLEEFHLPFLIFPFFFPQLFLL